MTALRIQRIAKLLFLQPTLPCGADISYLDIRESEQEGSEPERRLRRIVQLLIQKRLQPTDGETVKILQIILLVWNAGQHGEP